MQYIGSNQQVAVLKNQNIFMERCMRHGIIPKYNQPVTNRLLTGTYKAGRLATEGHVAADDLR